MEVFSKRNKFAAQVDSIQLEQISQNLKMRIWNNIIEYKLYNKGLSHISLLDQNKKQEVTKVWSEFLFKNNLYLPKTYNQFLEVVFIKYSKIEWFEIYDFIEFLICNDEFTDNDLFIEKMNDAFSLENSGYRILNDRITPIINEIEIESIETSLNDKNLSNSVKTHLKRALELLSERKNPDYRNSIKESISAVESLCIQITGNSKATLGQALKQIEKTTNLHKSIQNAFSNLYGFTSESEGIRHALMTEPTLKKEDAIFMLVSCSSFINYLKAKQ